MCVCVCLVQTDHCPRKVGLELLVSHFSSTGFMGMCYCYHAWLFKNVYLLVHLFICVCSFGNVDATACNVWRSKDNLQIYLSFPVSLWVQVLPSHYQLSHLVCPSPLNLKVKSWELERWLCWLLMKYPLCKHEDLHLIISTHIKSKVVCTIIQCSSAGSRC